MLQRLLYEAKWRKRMTDADVRALSPLVYAHVNPYGLFELDSWTWRSGSTSN